LKKLEAGNAQALDKGLSSGRLVWYMQMNVFIFFAAIF